MDISVLKTYKKYEENNETLITIYFYNIKKEEAINLVQKELNKISLIQNLSKKKKLNSRFYNLKLKLEKEMDNSVISSLYLINDEIFEYIFNEENIKTINEYKLKDLYVKKDIIFDIDYLLDVFTNFNFNYICHVQKSNLKLKIINTNKNKLLTETKFTNEKNMIEIINNYILEHKINEILVYGLNLNMKCLNDEKNKKILFENNDFSSSQVNEYFYKRKCEKNNELLEKKLNELTNPNTNLELFVFGKLKKEILESIENFQLKELYIEKRKLDILKQCISDESCLNFKIIEIESLIDGDIASQFFNDYKGLMGIKYF